jgi:hypothetical protein
MNLRIETKRVAELSFDPENARSHSSSNLDAIKRSLSQFGQRKPIVLDSAGVVVAGNGTLQAAIALGWSEIDTVSVPADWSDEQVKAFAIADNRSAELAEWNSEKLALQLSELEEFGWDLKDLGFTKTELADIIDEGLSEERIKEENAYTAAINVPQYEIVGEEPSISELVSADKTNRLRTKIMNSSAPEEVKDFLIKASNRHLVFNYRKIAEFYAHASAEVQELMEESALVIIDANDAIRYGYANFIATINELESNDRNASE